MSSTERRGQPQLYNTCGGKDGQYETLYLNRYVPYTANEWMTFSMHVKIVTWYKSDSDHNETARPSSW